MMVDEVSPVSEAILDNWTFSSSVNLTGSAEFFFSYIEYTILSFFFSASPLFYV